MFSTLALAFTAALISIAPATATAASPICDLYSFIPLTQTQKQEAAKMGYRLQPTPRFTTDVPRTGWILRKENTYVGLSRAYQIEKRLVVAHYDGVKYFGIEANPDPVRSIPNCQTAIRKSHEMHLFAHIRFYANEIVKHERGMEANVSLGNALLATEALQMYPKFNDAVREYKRMSGEYNQYVQQASKLKDVDPLLALDELRAIVAPRMKNYCGPRRTLSDFFKPGDQCGNCVSQTILLTALITDAKLKTPQGKRLAIQKFNDHVRPVLLGPTKNDLYDLVYGKSDDNFTGGLYKLNLVAYVRVKSLVALYPRALRGFEAYSSAKNRFGHLMIPGEGNGILSGSKLVLSNIILGLTPEVRFYRNLSWQEQTYDWGASTGMFGDGKTPPDRSNLDLSGRSTQTPKPAGLLTRLTDSVGDLAGKLRGGEQRKPFYKDDVLSERFFSRTEIARLKPLWSRQTSNAFKRLLEEILSKDVFFGDKVTKAKEQKFLHPIEFRYESKASKQATCLKVAMTPVKSFKTKDRQWDEYGKIAPNAKPTAEQLQACNDENLRTIEFNGAYYIRLIESWDGTPGTFTIYDKALYDRVVATPAALRPRFMLDHFVKESSRIVRSPQFDRYKRDLLDGQRTDKHPEIEAFLKDLASARQLVDSYSMILELDDISSARSPLFSGWIIIGTRGSALPRTMLPELLEINHRQMKGLVDHRWEILKAMNTKPAADIGKFDRSDLGQFIPTEAIETPEDLQKLSVFMPKNTKLESQGDYADVVNPLRAFTIAMLFDPDFELTPPQDPNQKRLHQLAKQRVQEKREERKKLEERKPGPGGTEKPQTAQEAQAAQKEIKEIKIELITEVDLPVLPKLERKPKAIRADILKELLFRGLKSDYMNPAIQFALMPIMTKDTYDHSSMEDMLHAITPALLLPGAELSKAVDCKSQATSRHCLTLAARFVRDLTTAKLPKHKLPQSSFFNLHPVLEIGRAYYDLLPAKYVGSWDESRLRFFQKVPPWAHVANSATKSDTPNLKVATTAGKVYHSVFWTTSIKVPTSSKSSKTVSFTRWAVSERNIELELLTYGTRSTVPITFNSANSDELTMVNPAN